VTGTEATEAIEGGNLEEQSLPDRTMQDAVEFGASHVGLPACAMPE
jgi:hypothetical protein